MDAITTLLAQLQQVTQDGTLSKLTLSKPRTKQAELRNIYARLIELKRGTVLSCTLRYQTRDETLNLPLADVGKQVHDWLEQDFYFADLYTGTTQYSLLTNKKGKSRLTEKKIAVRQASNSSHDQVKQHALPDLAKRPYLVSLGVTSAKGTVLQHSRRKFRQINKYVELIAHLLEEHPLQQGAHIVDMGSGKGYLTFALYDYLQNERQLNIQLTGIELRPGLVAQCSDIAKQEAFSKLQFIAEDIHTYQPEGGIDMLIALHACDTATDEAIAKGINAKADIIIVAPCCHKQVRKAISIPEDLKPMLQHGILLERQAEMLTDAIRSLYLEAAGYRTKVFEFIGTEHTPKNVMITAVKATPRPAALAEIAALKKSFGIHYHHLERLLANQL